METSVSFSHNREVVPHKHTNFMQGSGICVMVDNYQIAVITTILGYDLFISPSFPGYLQTFMAVSVKSSHLFLKVCHRLRCQVSEYVHVLVIRVV